ncbi:MAG: molecular chaperone TorD family protein [Oscillatoria princeps RMCB-10]|nr:molecular chaperone TorD family protein [Oscillatoria princeps RMCB-10]
MCFPYPGYHLFGESYKRGEFLAKLKQKYRARGFTEESSELADHLTVLLRFIASLPPEDILAQELVEDCLVPALHKMNEGFKEGNPYAQVLEALLGVLEEMAQTSPV